MDAVQHFEIPYRNRDRAKKFYFQAFGWQVFDLPGSPYSLANSVDTQPNGMPKRPGAINGGLVPRGKEVTGPTLFLRVTDLPSHLHRIRQYGGTVLTEPVAQGPVLFARFRDPEGNVMTAFQHVGEPQRAKPAKAGGKAAKAKAKPKAAKKAKPARKAKAKAAKPAKATWSKPAKAPARKKREAKPVWSR